MNLTTSRIVKIIHRFLMRILAISDKVVPALYNQRKCARLSAPSIWC